MPPALHKTLSFDPAESLPPGSPKTLLPARRKTLPLAPSKTLLSADTQTLSAARRVWQEILAGGPYTALKMIEYLKQQGGKTYEGFLANPRTALEGVTNRVIGKHDINAYPLSITWNSMTGRCTSFAIKAVNDLERKGLKDAANKPAFDFEIFDLGRHRVARCKKTGILIDSSSTKPGGAFVLPEGAEWLKFGESRASWKYSNSKSKFERNGNPDSTDIKASGAPITQKEAMHIWLKEIETNLKGDDGIPTLFRSVQGGRPVFHGMVFWAPKDRALELVLDLKTKRKRIIQWARNRKTKAGKNTGVIDASMQGSEEDELACVKAMTDFVQMHGGPRWEAQWNADGINLVNNALFMAATALWGHPKLVDRTQIKPKPKTKPIKKASGKADRFVGFSEAPRAS